MVTFLAGFVVGCVVTLLIFAAFAWYVGPDVTVVTFPEGTKRGEAESSE